MTSTLTYSSTTRSSTGSYGDDFEAPYQELPADIAAQLPTPGELHDVLTDHAIEQVEPLSDEGE